MNSVAPRRSRFVAILSALLLLSSPCSAAPEEASFPNAPTDPPEAGDRQSIVLAGGCFWGIEALFRHVRGVHAAVSGYAGGSADDAHYVDVASGDTGHAEAVEVTYDPAVVTLGTLLKIFFSVAHDPTQVDRQGPDVGKQYRSAIFYGNPEQRRTASSYVAALESAGVFPAPIATHIVPLSGFYPAEPYHQDYVARHPDQPYVAINDLPKLERLRREFPAQYR